MSNPIVVKRVEHVRLYPTNRQRGRLQFMLDVTRELYNALLEERREAYRRRGVRVGMRQQYRELTILRTPAHRIDSRLRAVYRECEDAVLHRLELAFAAFFRRVATSQTPGYPRYKSAGRWAQLEFSHGARALKFNTSQSKITVPGVGAIRLRKGRAVPVFGRAWLVRKNGRWYACFECQRDVNPLPQSRHVIGIDRGAHVLAATSDGLLIGNKAFGERNRHRIARHQRRLEELSDRDAAGRVRNRHDPRRKAAALQFARAKEREANRRRDYLHKVARSIVDSAGIIALERLRLRAMTSSAKGSIEEPGRNVAAKAALNRKVLDAGLGQLHRLIAEKAEEAARRVVLIDARFSSQECSRCGHVAKENRRRRRFACVRCGFCCHADVNAALVIRRRAQLSALRMPMPVRSRSRSTMLHKAFTTNDFTCTRGPAEVSA
ncbi:MAG TPA: transposase [Candidatus Baltobacteraceae bacterium]|nr:transposase [Candidatus Baltobacteraceae bacterium]